MKSINFEPDGVCTKEIKYQIKDGLIKNLSFTSGCSGNLKALAVLMDGMSVVDVKDKLRGITCGSRSTSCVDQLVKSIEKHEGNI